PDVRGVQPELIHQVKQPDLVLDRRARDRRALEPVAQRFIVEIDGLRGTRWILGRVPVVDELVLGWPHGSSVGGEVVIGPYVAACRGRLSSEPMPSAAKLSRAALSVS